MRVLMRSKWMNLIHIWKGFISNKRNNRLKEINQFNGVAIRVHLKNMINKMKARKVKVVIQMRSKTVGDDCE